MLGIGRTVGTGQPMAGGHGRPGNAGIPSLPVNKFVNTFRKYLLRVFCIILK